MKFTIGDILDFYFAMGGPSCLNALAEELSPTNPRVDTAGELRRLRLAPEALPSRIQNPKSKI